MSAQEFKDLKARPTAQEVTELASELGIHLPDGALPLYTDSLQVTTEVMKEIVDWEDDVTDVSSRDAGHMPSIDENTHGQWVWKCEIQEKTTGKLAGRRVAIKDAIAVAGIPMDVGTEGLRGYKPKLDAPVVTRILAEGGVVVGKTTCENLCFSALSHTSCHGVVRNPHDTTRTTGGSSSGSAAAVTLGNVDLALGSDTGGSVRMPSALCGCVGIKPTFGLVPTTGLNACILSCDHVGPICKTVKDAALLLEVIAGPEDNLHPIRQSEPDTYLDKLDQGVKGLRVGIVREGFNGRWKDENVNEVVLEMIEKLKTLGVIFEDISVPEHDDGFLILAATAQHEYTLGVKGNAQPYAGRSYSMIDMINNFKDSANTQNEYGKMCYIWDLFYQKNFAGLNLLPKSINRMNVVRRAYENVFRQYDAVVMPTVPVKAPVNPQEPLTMEGKTINFFPITPNTCPFDSSGHPSITVNAGWTTPENMPVGIQFSGRFYDEATIFRLAQAVENLAPKKQ